MDRIVTISVGIQVHRQQNPQDALRLRSTSASKSRSAQPADGKNLMLGREKER